MPSIDLCLKPAACVQSHEAKEFVFGENYHHGGVGGGSSSDGGDAMAKDYVESASAAAKGRATASDRKTWSPETEQELNT